MSTVHSAYVEMAVMNITDKIQAYVHKLPAPLQSEVLDFVEYLLSKAERDVPVDESESWSAWSLASAMRGMEEEETPTYQLRSQRLKTVSISVSST